MDRNELELKFVKVIQTYEPMIMKVCRMYTYNNVDKQDLYQEIVMQLWKAFPKFRGEASISTFLYRVAINTAITGVQKHSRKISVESTGELPEAININTNDELWQRMYEAVEHLNEIEKAVVMLYLEDYSYEEMEKILGLNEGNLRVKMNRIKQKLKQLTSK